MICFISPIMIWSKFPILLKSLHPYTHSYVIFMRYDHVSPLYWKVFVAELLRITPVKIQYLLMLDITLIPQYIEEIKPHYNITPTQSVTIIIRTTFPWWLHKIQVAIYPLITLYQILLNRFLINKLFNTMRRIMNILIMLYIHATYRNSDNAIFTTVILLTSPIVQFCSAIPRAQVCRCRVFHDIKHDMIITFSLSPPNRKLHTQDTVEGNTDSFSNSLLQYAIWHVGFPCLFLRYY